MSDVPIFYNLETAGDVTAITGKLADLETTVNTNLVAAINEIDGKFPVSVSDGGTGQTTLTSGNILVGNGTDGITSISTVPIANGGTGGTTATDARTNLGVMTGVQLYYNTSGSSGTIELSDEIKNYQCIDIGFFISVYSSVFYSVTRIVNLGENSVVTGLNLNVAGTYTSGGTSHPRVNVFSSNIAITGNSITRSRDNRAYVTDTMTPVVQTTSTDTPAIYKVVGFTY